MAARTLPNSAIAIWGGEVLEARSAPTGERAVNVALLMLAEMNELVCRLAFVIP